MRLIELLEVFALGAIISGMLVLALVGFFFLFSSKPDFELTECERIAENYRTQTGYYDIFNCKEGILQIEEKGDWR